MKRVAVGMIVALTMGLTITGCTPFRPAERTSLESELPQTYSNKSNEMNAAGRWWEAFEDQELNALIELALADNLTLKESWARLRQARALAAITGAALYPDLSGTAGASVGRQRNENTTTTTEGTEQYSLGLLSNYEIDLWGRIRSEEEAALLSATASREDFNTAAMTVAAAVAERWVGIISQRMQKRLLEEQTASNKTILGLLELRFHNALATAVDVFQQRQVVERSKSQIPLVEQTEQLLSNELALLLGKFSQSAPVIRQDTLKLPGDVPATGLPAQLLTARPDVRAAMFRLQAADWQVSAARADRLPSIRLTGKGTYQAEKLGLLFDNWLINLAANLTTPIFDAGRRAEEVERQRAVVTENLAAYRKTLLTAVKEVEDALVKENKLREHIDGLEAQLQAAQNALNEAGSRYRKGLTDYLPVLTELLATQSLERDLILRKTDLLIARVNLYRALGGTWTDDLSPFARKEVEE